MNDLYAISSFDAWGYHQSGSVVFEVGMQKKGTQGGGVWIFRWDFLGIRPYKIYGKFEGFPLNSELFGLVL